MIADTNRRALRAALPWLFVGFLLLAFSIGLWLVGLAPAESWLASFGFERAGTLCGLLGSASFLVGLAHLARALIGSRPSPALWLALLLWTGELALRVYTLVSAPVDAAEPVGVRAGGGTELGARLLLIAAAMIALCAGMTWIWGSHSHGAPRRIWRLTRILFTAQLLALLSLYVAAYMHARTVHDVFEELRGAVPFHLGWSLAWLAFGVPFGLLFLALQRTVAHTARRQSVADILTS